MGNQETKVHDTHGNVCCQVQARILLATSVEVEIYFYDPLGNKTLSQVTVYQGNDEKRMVENEWRIRCDGETWPVAWKPRDSGTKSCLPSLQLLWTKRKN